MIRPKIKKIDGCMQVVRITGNYQVTIPVEVRKALNIQKGDYIEVFLDELGGARIKLVEMVEKRVKQTNTKDREEEQWRRSSQENFLKGYCNEDAVYDNYDEEIKKI